MPWRRKSQPTPIFLLGKFHGQKSLAGYSPWDHKESDMTEKKKTEKENNVPHCSPLMCDSISTWVVAVNRTASNLKAVFISLQPHALSGSRKQIFLL
jgi:hypothetical protein